jgi:small subunit ribosomal protein S15
MYLTKEKKEEIFAEYGASATDTGSAEGQIALFSFRIDHLTDHLEAKQKRPQH